MTKKLFDTCRKYASKMDIEIVAAGAKDVSMFSQTAGMGKLNMSASQWLWLIKLFELEISNHRIVEKYGLVIRQPLKLRI